MGRLRQIIELAANLAILCVCLMLLVLFVRHGKSIINHQAPADPSIGLTGKTVGPLSDYQWKDHPKTMVLAVRSGCRFCEASYPFYRRLAALQATHPDVHLLAVMPDNASSGSSLLNQENLHVDRIYQTPLDTLHVEGTPTIILLNSVGRIERAWVGQLPPAREAEVVNSFIGKQ